MNDTTDTAPTLNDRSETDHQSGVTGQKKESLTDRLNILLPPRQTASAGLGNTQELPGMIPKSVWVITGCLGLLIFLLSLNTAYLRSRIVWNTKIGSVSVGGKTISEARELLRTETDAFLAYDIQISAGNKTYSVSHAAISPVYDYDKALENAYQVGRGREFLKNSLTRFLSFFRSREIPLYAWFSEDQLITEVTRAVPEYRDQKPVDAKVIQKGYRFVAEPGADGMGFDEKALCEGYRKIIENQHNDELQLHIIRRTPDIDMDMAEKAARIANNVTRRFLVMRYSYDGYNFDSWTLSLREVRDWIEFRKEKEFNNHNLYVVLNNDKIRKHISRRIAPYMYMAKQDITVRSVDGKPAIEGVAKDGYYLDLRRSVKSINDCISYERIDTTGNLIVWLDVAHLVGGIANPDNEYQISDVLATGVTDFFGSPENRKFNIKHSSPRFQNIILHPGERFSFVKHMGKVDSASGYMRELVIVDGDSTEPQYGGGLCQVSSTLFRTIFFAGLPVVSRVSHSFEVKYYRPAGLDATIFNPYPDLIFENDTKNLVLVQNFVDLNRTKMYFKFFGKKDGRRLRFEGPIVKENVGEKKEHYRVTWYRHIEYADGTEKTEKFNSLYLNKDLVKKYQPENILMQKDSVFVPVAYDSTKKEEKKKTDDGTLPVKTNDIRTGGHDGENPGTE